MMLHALTLGKDSLPDTHNPSVSSCPGNVLWSERPGQNGHTFGCCGFHLSLVWNSSLFSCDTPEH